MKTADDVVFGLFGNAGKPAAVDAVRGAIEFLEDRDIAFIVEEDIASMLEFRPAEDSSGSVNTRAELGRQSDFAITFGGDGTMLMALQWTLPWDTPVLGVNLGKLGFLADVSVPELPWAIEQIIHDRHTVERRMTITGRIEGVTEESHALNDLVIGKSGTAKIIGIDAWVNGEFLASFLADGIIISTPTGSTAYSLATGGPVVVPSSEVIIISPISAHTLTARPVIVPGSSVITLRASTDEGMLMVMNDGQPVVHDARETAMEISRGRHSAALIKNLGPNYFETLRTKLSWAQDGRMQLPMHHNDVQNR
jgi:NAD+ kinase